jgi:hypothetical protein
MRNFDFDGDIDDQNRFSKSDKLDTETKHVTVEGLLCLKYGKLQGRSIYRELLRVATQAAETNGGEPGIIFNDEGGSFVSFHKNEFE